MKQINTQTFTVLRTSGVRFPFVLDIGEYSSAKEHQIHSFLRILNELVIANDRAYIYWLHHGDVSKALIYQVGQYKKALDLYESGEICKINLEA